MFIHTSLHIRNSNIFIPLMNVTLLNVKAMISGDLVAGNSSHSVLVILSEPHAIWANAILSLHG